ncbi:hypothetical protein MRX96_033411 [Rhipicephalus microplus]
MKLEKHQLGGMEEASARGGILYVFYQMYQNYDQVVADEEARIRGDQQCATVNAPVVTGYMFQQGHPVGVPAVGGTAPVGLIRWADHKWCLRAGRWFPPLPLLVGQGCLKECLKGQACLKGQECRKGLECLKHRGSRTT